MVKTERATDIYDLVSYTLGLDFPSTIKFICEEIGISYYHDFGDGVPESFKILKMLQEMETQIDVEEEAPLKPISEKVIGYYKPYVNDLFYKDNIGYATQKEFGIGYDPETNRITIPIYSEINDLVGVKGRLFKEHIEPYENKYLYIEPCPKSQIIYGLHKTIDYIKNSNRIYIGEAEKFVMQLWEYGFRNSGATGGKQLTQWQIELLVRLGVEIVFCFDKDVTKQEVEELACKFPEGIDLFYMFDEHDKMTHEKESPSDNPDVWFYMINNNLYKIR